MSTVLSDPLATSAETWRERSAAEPAIPPELVPPPHGVSRRERSRRCTAATCCASSAPSTRTPRPATRCAAGRWPTTTS